VVVRQYFYEKSETESGSADFFMNPSESVRLQDFGIRNNTMQNVSIQQHKVAA